MACHSECKDKYDAREQTAAQMEQLTDQPKAALWICCYAVGADMRGWEVVK